jgi:hypothetical protein
MLIAMTRLYVTCNNNLLSKTKSPYILFDELQQAFSQGTYAT